MPDPAVSDQSAMAAPHYRLARLVPLALVVAVTAVALAMGWHKQLSLSSLIAHRAAVEAFVTEHWVAALAAYVGTYLAVAATVATLIGATAGATVIFLVAKRALGGWLVRKAGPRVEKIAAGFCADGFNYLLFLRLVPLFPFWLVNLVPALLVVPLRTFVAATALGIIPG